MVKKMSTTKFRFFLAMWVYENYNQNFSNVKDIINQILCMSCDKNLINCQRKKKIVNEMRKDKSLKKDNLICYSVKFIL